MNDNTPNPYDGLAGKANILNGKLHALRATDDLGESAVRSISASDSTHRGAVIYGESNGFTVPLTPDEYAEIHAVTTRAIARHRAGLVSEIEGLRAEIGGSNV